MKVNGRMDCFMVLVLFTNNGNLRYGTWQNGVPWEVSEIDKDGEVIRIWEEGVDIENEITPLNAPMFLSIGTIITALKDQRRYLKVTTDLMITDMEVYKILKSRLIEVKDITLSVFQNLTVQQVKSQEVRESLRDDIINKISSILPKKILLEDKNPIQKVLFEEFVLQ